ncbi:hypothetical protein D3C87_1709490 [compost metagenome]
MAYQTGESSQLDCGSGEPHRVPWRDERRWAPASDRNAADRKNRLQKSLSIEIAHRLARQPIEQFAVSIGLIEDSFVSCPAAIPRFESVPISSRPGRPGLSDLDACGSRKPTLFDRSLERSRKGFE